MGAIGYRRMARLICRGQVWIADLNPGFGAEIHKKRPVLIISNNTINNNWPRVVVLPFSTQIYPLHPGKVLIEKGLSGIDKESIILTQDVRSIDKTRLIEKIGVLSKKKISVVEESLKLVLGMIKL